MTAPSHRGAQPRAGGFIPLFWRLFIPNATVLVAASVVLMIEPANGRVIALAGGLALMLTINLLLMRRAIAPLARLMSVMEQIDPLEPGRRLPATPAESEVTALTDGFNRMLERLEDERRDSGYRALAAQEEERRHVATELHDEIGQALTALLLDLDRVGREAPPGARAAIDGLVATTRDTLEVVRSIAHRLRPEVLDTLGLVPAVRNLCDRLGAGAELIVHRRLPADLPPLSQDAELVIYRVAQESLTNVVRHARASRATVTLAPRPGAVELVVADDGVGFPAAPAVGSAGGIRGMRERALSIGAKLDLRASDAGGAEVALRVPLA